MRRGERQRRAGGTRSRNSGHPVGCGVGMESASSRVPMLPYPKTQRVRRGEGERFSFHDEAVVTWSRHGGGGHRGRDEVG